MRISPFGAAMTISNVASISIMGLSRARRHRDFLFEADRMTSKISAAETDCALRGDLWRRRATVSTGKDHAAPRRAGREEKLARIVCAASARLGKRDLG